MEGIFQDMGKTALVLSGGALFGAYHAGAWRALEREVSLDIVVGASVGSLNGWAIAGGCAADDLAGYWLDPSAAKLIRYRVPLAPWRGFFSPWALEERAQSLFATFRPIREFGVVVVEFPRFRSKLVTGADVTWRHLVASCAVPGGFGPIQVDGRSYVDGGLLCTTPVWAAVEMGATSIVAVNALPMVPSRVVRGAARGLRMMAKERPTQVPAESGIEVVMIVPPAGPLGTLSEALNWRADNVTRWIDQGERDAKAALKAWFSPAS